ncbi:MAG: YihY/virulence factor BrkB family protein [Candidatus Nanopelagicales bacterium]|nr:YihY/virulence factor BrkB family protein [Candidatus Nanopelagicales bacterium]
MSDRPQEPAAPRGADPADRVREEGGSPSLVLWTGRIDQHVPAAGGHVGFWAAVYARFARHRGSVLAGGLAFFALLSLVPAFLSLGAVVAMFLDPAQFVASTEKAFASNPEFLAVLQPFLDQIAALSPTAPGSMGVAGIAGFLVSLYAASRFVYVGRQVLDIAFELEPQHPSVVSRAVAVLITLVVELVIIVGVLTMTFVPRILDALDVGDTLSQTLRYGRIPLALCVVYLLLTAAMRYGIRARRAVRWLNVGAALGTLLIALGTVGLGWYLSASATYSQIVAVLGGVIALEIWLYLIGLAIVGAAEIEGMRLGFRRRDLRPD